MSRAMPRMVGSGHRHRWSGVAGDTVRWIVGDTERGRGESRRVHILVKPTRITPWVVDVDHLGQAQAVGARRASVSTDTRL